MSNDTTIAARASVALAGKMLQFNISVILLLAGLILTLWLCSSSTNPVLCYGGTAIALIGILSVVGFVVHFHSKQEVRPTDSQSSSITIKGTDGESLTIKNPPDKLLQPNHVRALWRQLMVGYDEKVCPDGEVIGPASAGNYRTYSDDEKAKFKVEHKAQVETVRSLASELLAIDGINEPVQEGGPESSGTIIDRSEEST